jgi:hypothetical protein
MYGIKAQAGSMANLAAERLEYLPNPTLGLAQRRAFRDMRALIGQTRFASDAAEPHLLDIIVDTIDLFILPRFYVSQTCNNNTFHNQKQWQKNRPKEFPSPLPMVNQTSSCWSFPKRSSLS